MNFVTIYYNNLLNKKYIYLNINISKTHESIQKLYFYALDKFEIFVAFTEQFFVGFYKEFFRRRILTKPVKFDFYIF